MKITDLQNYSVVKPGASIQQQPQESDQLPQENGSFLGNAASAVGNALGGAVYSFSAPGRTITRGLDSLLGKETTPEQQKAAFEQSTGADVDTTAGQVGQFAGEVASFAAPGGIVSKAGQNLTSTGARLATQGALSGTADAATQVARTGEIDEQTLQTFAIGALLPAGSEALGAAARAVSKGVLNIATGAQGIVTGTSAGTLEQAFNAARVGGQQLEDFTQTLRGQITPEKLVEDFRNGIQTVNTQRQTLFSETLKELGDNVVETAPALRQFDERLADAKITVGDDGVLDFTNSKLRRVPQAQAKLQEAYEELRNLPPTATLEQVDTTRQAIKTITLAGDDATANLSNALIDDAVRSVRSVGEEVSGYGEMLDNFGAQSEFLKQLQAGLASGDKRTIDQTYRRMATSLKTNNEQRRALVQELDRVTDGSILSQISGQQLSETIPRGIVNAIAAGLAGSAAVTGGAALSLIPGLVFTSPRITGEVVRSLGIGARKAEAIIDAISTARKTLSESGLIRATIQATATQE